MIAASWPCPLPGGGDASEIALTADHGRTRRLLIIPALFEEANRMRRFTVEIMRRLDAAGIDCFLPDLPGCNESLAPLEAQTPVLWRNAMTAAAAHFRANRVLTIRGGALMAPDGLPGWRYAPASGAGLLRQMLRARILAAREGGVSETQEALLAQGMADGVDLAGYSLSSGFVTEFHNLEPDNTGQWVDIPQDLIGGSGLWLRAEPAEDAAQADALAAIVAIGTRADSETP